MKYLKNMRQFKIKLIHQNSSNIFFIYLFFFFWYFSSVLYYIYICHYHSYILTLPKLISDTKEKRFKKKKKTRQ